MLKAKLKSNQTDLARRILQLRDECERLIDEEAERTTPPGVPTISVRQIITAYFPDNPWANALHILQTQKDGN
jgi:hypothetical protein